MRAELKDQSWAALRVVPMELPWAVLRVVRKAMQLVDWKDCWKAAMWAAHWDDKKADRTDGRMAEWRVDRRAMLKAVMMDANWVVHSAVKTASLMADNWVESTENLLVELTVVRKAEWKDFRMVE